MKKFNKIYKKLQKNTKIVLLLKNRNAIICADWNERSHELWKN